MDFKYKDVEAMADKSIVATLLNGAIRSSEQEEMAHCSARKSQFLIAYGACAHLGGIPSLANQFQREQILKLQLRGRAHRGERAESPPADSISKRTAGTRTLPELRHVVRSLDQVVDVDFYIPGCPPTPNLTKAAFAALLSGQAAAEGRGPGTRHRALR